MMSSHPPHSISPTDAPSRLLFHRPDLVTRRKQRKMAKKLSQWAGHTRSVVDVLAGCLAVLTDCSVEQLVDRLASDVEAAASRASVEEREKIASQAYRMETAFNLGWTLIEEGPQRDLIRVLALAGGGPLPRTLLRQAAGADSASLDHALLAGFCFSGAQDDISTEQPLVDYLLEHCLDSNTRERLRLRLLEALHSALLDPLEETGDCLESAWRGCWALCSAPEDSLLRASMMHRWVTRLRSRGEMGRALEFLVQETSTSTQDSTPETEDEPTRELFDAYRGLIELDKAVLYIEDGSVDLGLSTLRDLIEKYSQSRPEDCPETRKLLARARFIENQAKAFYIRDAKAKTSLAEHLARSETAADIQTTCEILNEVRQGALTKAQERLEKANDLNREGQAAWAAWIELSVSLAQAQARTQEADLATRNLHAARIASGGELDRRQLSTLPLTLHELGVLAAEQGELHSAGTFLDEAAMLGTSTLPQGHPTRLLTTYHRGLVHMARNDLRRAETQFRRVLEQEGLTLKVQRHVCLLARCARIVCWCLGAKDQTEKARAELRDVRTELNSWPEEEELKAEVTRIAERFQLV